MKKTPQIIIVFIFGLFSNLCFSQADSLKILWSDDYAITWDDFLAPPPDNSSLAAATKVDFYISYYANRSLATFHVKCFFNKSKSWVKEKYKTELILEHEKGHFDIGEIFSRKLKFYFQKKKKIHRKSIDNEYQKIFNKWYKEYLLFEKNYDAETYSGKQKQREWTEKIKSMLNELSEFAEPEIKVPVK